MGFITSLPMAKDTEMVKRFFSSLSRLFFLTVVCAVAVWGVVGDDLCIRGNFCAGAEFQPSYGRHARPAGSGLAHRESLAGCDL